MVFSFLFGGLLEAEDTTSRSNFRRPEARGLAGGLMYAKLAVDTWIYYLAQCRSLGSRCSSIHRAGRIIWQSSMLCAEDCYGRICLALKSLVASRKEAVQMFGHPIPSCWSTLAAGGERSEAENLAGRLAQRWWRGVRSASLYRPRTYK